MMCGNSENKRSDRDKDGFDRGLSLDCTGSCRPLTNPSFVLQGEKSYTVIGFVLLASRVFILKGAL